MPAGTALAAHDYLDDFEKRTGWTPRLRTLAPGRAQLLTDSRLPTP